LTKIPTELYVYVPRRSAKGMALYTNAWCNLTRKDTGEGIAKEIISYLDGISLGSMYTAPRTGYAGPDDMNPKTVGLHPYYVEFAGDAEFELCKSEEILLKCDPNLASTRIKIEVAPVSGNTPLTIKATGFIEERYVTETGMPAGRSPAYSLPLDLMVFDNTSTKRLQVAKTMMSNPDGTYAIEYIFIKPGKYAIFVNFLGDNKYASAWSNNGQTTTITVTGGGLPLSFEETISVTVTGSKTIKRILSATEPTTPDGYDRAPEYDLDCGVLGKYWAYVKKAA